MLNDSQFERLAAYEKYMKTAIDSSYPRSPGPRGLREIHAVLREVDPQTPTLNTTCGTCILRLLKKAGRLYFEKKDLNSIKVLENADPNDPLLKVIRQAEIDKANDAEAVAVTLEAAAPKPAPAPKKAPAKSGTKSTKKTTKK